MLLTLTQRTQLEKCQFQARMNLELNMYRCKSVFNQDIIGPYWALRAIPDFSNGWPKENRWLSTRFFSKHVRHKVEWDFGTSYCVLMQGWQALRGTVRLTEESWLPGIAAAEDVWL